MANMAAISCTFPHTVDTLTLSFIWSYVSVHLLNVPLCSPVSLQLTGCLLFGAKQVLYNGFLEVFRAKRLPAAAKHDAVRALRVNRNSKAKQ